MIEVPVLDDKSYHELLQESLSSIPSLTGKWTDFNPQDTGVMLLELCAGLTEMQRFYLDQVDDRYYRRFIRLLMDCRDNGNMEELFSAFTAYSGELKRAVSPQDFRHILTQQHPELGLDKIYSEFDNRLVRIYVYRKGKEITDTDLAEIQDCLEGYRLLTKRIEVIPIQEYVINVSCRLGLKGTRGQTNLLEQRAKAYLEQAVTEKWIQSTLNVEAIRAQILSIPGVSYISELTFTDAGGSDLEIAKMSYVCFQLGKVRFEYTVA